MNNRTFVKVDVKGCSNIYYLSKCLDIGLFIDFVTKNEQIHGRVSWITLTYFINLYWQQSIPNQLPKIMMKFMLITERIHRIKEKRTQNQSQRPLLVSWVGSRLIQKFLFSEYFICQWVCDISQVCSASPYKVLVWTCE